MSHQSLAVKELLSPNSVLVVDMCGLCLHGTKRDQCARSWGSQVSPAFLRRSTTDSVNVQLGLGDIMAGGEREDCNERPKAKVRET